MRNPRQQEDRIILILFIFICLILGAVFVFREHVFQYIDERVSLEESASDLLSSVAEQEVKVYKEDLFDLSLFENEKFKDLERDPVSLPRFKAGRKDPFDIPEEE